MTTMTRRAILRGSAAVASAAAAITTLLPGASPAAAVPVDDTDLDQAIRALWREREAVMKRWDEMNDDRLGEQIIAIDERILATPAESGTGLMFKMNLLTSMLMEPDIWRPTNFDGWQWGKWHCDTQAMIAMEIEVRRLCGLRLPSHDARA